MASAEDRMVGRAFEVSPLAPRRTAEEEARDRDLGFGSVVSRTTGLRLLNRDGTFNVRRAGLGVFSSLAPYHHLLTTSWSDFLGLVALFYLGVNVLFAFAYLACGRDALLGPGREMLGGRFAQTFFFSIQTFATIGYGQIAPNGLAANLVVTIESLVGLMYQALATGLLFARFARPTASIVFSKRAVIAPYNGGRALMFRIANRRRNEIVSLEAQVMFTERTPTDGGAAGRIYRLLTLERNRVTFFPLSWTIVHPIDERSPLASKTPEELERTQAEILILLAGVDETFEQTVHARSSYSANEIVWNARFRSMFVASRDEPRVTVDITRLHEIERL